ncbi:MAG TPA: PmoA family protein [Acidobacteriota bacterium]|nr:PmoA family protein [Acidobacteriota bacterium]
MNLGLRVCCTSFAFVACLGSMMTGAAISHNGHASGYLWHRDAQTVGLLKEGKTVWQFNYSPGLSKPYFHPVALPGGSDLTWLSPPDHPHHFALFFSWKYLNHVNYWEEPAGVPDGATKWSNVRIETRPDFSARITMDLQYHPQRTTDVVLSEKRAIRVSPPTADDSYFMDWRLEFTSGDQDVVMDRTPPDTTPDGNARGGYAGLSVRLSGQLSDPRITSTGDIGTLQNNRYGFAAGAAEFSGEIDGGQAGIAFLDHPSNLRSPTRWYGIIDKSVPFWFLNASLLQLEPYTLAARRTLDLRYRVIVHPQRWDAARLNEEYARYVEEERRN